MSVKKLKWKLLLVIKFIFYFCGRSWNDFYGWMLDYQDRKISIDDILNRKGPKDRYKGLWHWEKGEDYLRYMVKYGLKPDHTVFDLGCGYGRCTIPLLRYQSRKGHYIGSEISKKRLQLAADWIHKEKLHKKSFELIFSKDEALEFLKDDSVDVTWVLSVFNHLPDVVFEKTISALSKKMKIGGFMFAYYVTEMPGYSSIKFFPRGEQEMTEILVNHGFEVKVLHDWEHEYPEENRTGAYKMILATKQSV